MASPAEHPQQGAQPSPAAQDEAGVASGSRSAITAYDKMLQEKEQAIRENIARKYTKIHEVERQLESLRVALHVNVGPRRQALEHLRSKIEQQNHKIDLHRQDYRKYKQLADQALAAMEREEAQKNQMSEELNTLVQQSASAQLKKLEELSAELENLTAGLPLGLSSGEAGAAATNGSGTSASSGDATLMVAAAAPPVPSAADQEQQQQEQHAGRLTTAKAVGPEGEQQAADAARQQETQRETERQRRLLQQQRQAAADARARHVQLGARRASCSHTPTNPSQGAGTDAHHGGSSSASSGPFRGFD